MNLWTVVIGLLCVFGAGLAFWVVHYLMTLRRRRELESAADLEYEEMMVQKELMNESAVTFSRRHASRYMTESERLRENRLMTDAGKGILKLEETGRWIFIIGAMIALVVLTVYLKVN